MSSSNSMDASGPGTELAELEGFSVPSFSRRMREHGSSLRRRPSIFGTISVGWQGFLYDCDFHQVLELPLGGRRRTVHDIQSFDAVDGGEIAFGPHCYACAAGAGSSCRGALA